MKIQSQCAIVNDLLPSYSEGLTSQVTDTWVAEHLKNCSECQWKYEVLLVKKEQNKRSEKKRDKRIRRMLRGYRYQMLGAVLGIILGIMMIVGGLKFLGYCVQKVVTEELIQEIEYEDGGIYEK